VLDTKWLISVLFILPTSKRFPVRKNNSQLGGDIPNNIINASLGKDFVPATKLVFHPRLVARRPSANYPSSFSDAMRKKEHHRVCSLQVHLV
jgi:hypothetical protein